MAEQSLYELEAFCDSGSRLALQRCGRQKNPIVGQASRNPALREWHTNQLDRSPV